MKLKLKSLFVMAVALLITHTSMASSLMFKCTNSDNEEFMEIYLGSQTNHLLITKRVSGFGLVRGESATWTSKGYDDIFKPSSLVSSRRMIKLRAEQTAEGAFTLYLGYPLDPACPSCKSRHYTNGIAECQFKKKLSPDALNFYNYKREAHYPSNEYNFQTVMKEVGDDYWSPRAQITLVDPKTLEFLVINFKDGYIWLNGWSKNSGPNDFVEQSIRSFLKNKPLILEEATTRAGKCQFDALMKKQYPNNECLQLLDKE